MRFGIRVQFVSRIWNGSQVISAAVLISLLLAACASLSSNAPNAVETLSPVFAPSTTPQSTATTTPEPTEVPTGPRTLVIWWPEPLAPRENADAAEVLSEQISAFERAYGDVQVQFRLKLARDTGGIMQTLRAASGGIAPGALPDLTLIRREDLLAAAQAGLIQPIEDEIPPAFLGDLYTAGVELGQVNRQLYGIPYMLDVQHMAYRNDTVPIISWRLENFLRERIPFIFAGNRAAGTNDVFWVQYLAAGGTVPADGTFSVNADALEATLNFYEQALNRDVVSVSVLDYTSPRDFASQLASGEIDAAIITSTIYLELANQGQVLDVGPIPTVSGQAATSLNGWMWVMVSSNPEEQALAGNFLTWMMEVDMQSQYSQTIHMLPSQRLALRRWADQEYADFIANLLANATLPLPESVGGTAARSMQDALVSVLSGQQTADQAAQEVIDQLTN